MFSITVQSTECPLPKTLHPLPKISSVYIVGRTSALRDVIKNKVKRLGAQVSTSENIDYEIVKRSFCTIVVYGEDVDWSKWVSFSLLTLICDYLPFTTTAPFRKMRRFTHVNIEQ